MPSLIGDVPELKFTLFCENISIFRVPASGGTACVVVDLFPPAVWIGVGGVLLTSEHLVNEGSMQGRRMDMLIRDGFLAHFWQVVYLLTGEVGMLNSFRLVAYLCQKLESVTVHVLTV